MNARNECAWHRSDGDPAVASMQTCDGSCASAVRWAAVACDGELAAAQRVPGDVSVGAEPAIATVTCGGVS
jgi:hypothetical protein